MGGSLANTLGKLNPFRYRSYIYDPESKLYYLQSRYYDPEMGRFINADAFAATGQGLLGNNMFAYCNNNPVCCSDPSGEAGFLLASFAGVTLISAGANAISTLVSGGSFAECVAAGVAGAMGGAAGYAVAWALQFTPQGNIAGRATATAISDLMTALLLNGTITQDDILRTGVDIVMDVCYSTIGYYYNPVTDQYAQDLVNAGLDGFVDIVETLLFPSTDSNTSVAPSGAGIGKSTLGSAQGVNFAYASYSY